MSAMDDKQLTDLFRTAADDAGAAAPPPTFDHDDVLAGSHRMARRQRATVAVAVVAMVVVSVGAVFSGVLRGPSQTSALAERPPASSAAAPEDSRVAGEAAGAPGLAPVAPVPGVAPGLAPQMAPAPYAAKSAPPAGAAPDAAAGGAPNAAAGGAPFAADSAGPSARGKAVTGCAAPDARVFTQLTAVLPAAAAAQPHAVPGGCAPGGAGVAVEVNDAGAAGTLVAVSTPPTVDNAVAPDTAAQASATARTPSGGVLRLTAVGARPGAIPYRPRLAELAAALAAHL